MVVTYQFRPDAVLDHDLTNKEAITSIYRCFDGHLYTCPWFRSTLWLPFPFPIHFLGPDLYYFRRCPVDGRWRFATCVDPKDLTDQEIQEAERYCV